MIRNQRVDWMDCRPRWRRVLIILCACLIVPIGLGCGGKKKKVDPAGKLTSRYQSLPPKQVPAFLKDSIIERCDLSNIEPFPVSGFGLVANLHDTGDCFAGTAVREYIRTLAVKHGFGSKVRGLDNIQPEDILRDPSFAIVRVDALIPPGARKYQRLDVLVSALEGNNTTSLAHGDLYRTDLKVNGANMQAPGYAIDVWATAEGSIFVNPAYVLSGPTSDPEVRLSLRKGTIPDGGVCLMDRALVLRLRQPQLSMARAIEYRLDQAFQDLSVAAAKDEAIILLYMPEKYGTDWAHFAGVVTHTFLNPTPDFAVAKAKQLAEEAVKPDAPLLDISYCWEALGPMAVPFIAPLMTHEKPEVAYAAARAAACVGDLAAQTVLMEIAKRNDHPFQIEAVQTLGKLPSSPVINQMLRTLLDARQTLVRLEAYRALASHGDSSILSRPVNNKFMLDIVSSQGPPILYASRSGMPRIAVIGNRPAVAMPAFFTAMDHRFSMASATDRQLLNLFYRGPKLRSPISVISSPDLVELIERLGGNGAPGEQRLDFDYCVVVALLQAMAEQKQLVAVYQGQRVPMTFVLQESPGLERLLEQAPPIPESSPTTAQAPPTVGAAGLIGPSGQAVPAASPAVETARQAQ
ncbi:flagellar basal body P-ring protein FlgI [Fontivita pretiosa]|uniref:flagellar basal body P-ring protein FlgI n=1 Tax=Fontivita pretiosa TaxID=2989684 RepID=UPI003D16F845